MTAPTRRASTSAEVARSAANRHAEATRAIGRALDPSDQLRKATDYLRSIAKLLPLERRNALYRRAAELLVEETGRASQALTRGGDR